MKLHAILLQFTMLSAALFSAGCSSDDDPVDGPVAEPLFEIAVSDISAVGATIGVTPADRLSPYYFDVLDESDFRTAQRNGIDNYLQWMLEERLMGDLNYSFSEAVSLMTSVGKDEAVLEGLDPGTKYYVIAVGIDTEAYATTEVETKEFRTLDAVTSDNTFRIAVSELTQTNLRVAVTTSNDDPYFLDIQPVGMDEGMSDSEYAAYLASRANSWGVLAGHSFAGSCSVTLKELDLQLKPGWRYEVVVFGYENGLVTTPVERLPVEMPAGGDPASCTFRFDYELATYDRSRFTFTPSDPLAVYIGDVIRESEYQQYLAYCGGDHEKTMRELLDVLIDYYANDFRSRVETIDVVAQMGTLELSSNLVPDTDYRLWAVCIDQQGNPVAPSVTSEPFHSLVIESSDASVALTSYCWYDGDELYKADPKIFASARGYAVLALQAQPSASAVHWYIYSFLGDLRESSDRNVIKNLWSMGEAAMDQTEMLIICYWGENTICSVAEDAAGNYGPIGREVVLLDKAGATPVSSSLRAAAPAPCRRAAE